MDAALPDAPKPPSDHEQPAAPPPKGKVLVSLRIPKSQDAQIDRLVKAFEVLYEAQGQDASGVTPSWVIIEALKRGLPALEKLIFGQYAAVPESDDEKAWADFRRAIHRALEKLNR